MAVSQCVKKCVHYATVAVVLKLVSVLFPDTAFYYFICTANFILYVALATVTYNFCQHFYNNERVEADKKSVLITGCDTGFGHLLAKKLDSEGFQVFASCLFPEGEGAKQLKQSCSKRLHVLYLDVTKDETVEKALQFVKQKLGSNVFWAVVNNAGIAKGFSTDFSTMDDFKDTMDVNALGQVRVAKAFLPLLKISKGRVVNVTSLLARMSSVDVCAYVMSKYAALGFTECLSLEMDPWGIHSISIEPEYFRTALTTPELVIERLESGVSKIPKDVVASYEDGYVEKLKKALLKLKDLACFDIHIVVDTIEKAVTDKYPSHVYKPRRNTFARVLCYTLECLPFGLYQSISRLLMWFINYPLPKTIHP